MGSRRDALDDDHVGSCSGSRRGSCSGCHCDSGLLVALKTGQLVQMTREGERVVRECPGEAQSRDVDAASASA